MILRDRDANTAWNAEADSTREERVYFCQNWRADVSAILSSSGKMLEWVKYSAYGVPHALPSGDTDSDGDFDATDVVNILFSGGYDVRQDAELDGDVDSGDSTHANSITGGYQTLGRGVLSSTGVNNRRGYAGYEYDPTFEGADRQLYHVRHRVYDADIGRWTRRDPVGYLDGLSLYSYVQGLAVIASDPPGLFTCVGGCGVSPVVTPMPGGGGGPPSCAGGTCGTPVSNPPIDDGSGPIYCAGGDCNTPIDMTEPESGPQEVYCAGSVCSVPPTCPSSSGGGDSVSNDGGGGSDGGSIDTSNVVPITVAGCTDASGLSPRISKRLHFLLSRKGPVFGRGGKFGRGKGKPGGLLNRNNWVRLGHNWKGSKSAGSRVFRLAIGYKGGPVHWHVDLWKYGGRNIVARTGLYGLAAAVGFGLGYAISTQTGLDQAIADVVNGGGAAAWADAELLRTCQYLQDSYLGGGLSCKQMSNIEDSFEARGCADLGFSLDVQ